MGGRGRGREKLRKLVAAGTGAKAKHKLAP